MSNASNAKTKKVLIVEDEESNYELLKAMLRKLDVEVFWARNGKYAVDMCDENEFSLIFMDIKMPGMDGYDAVINIRNRGITTPIIAQTAYARIEEEEVILSRGFDAYISKPINRNRLNDLVNKFLF
ncbi:MAG: response regulator [Bacteroidales bacterium]|nr:response regulator [Bacteroidales bacterium]